MKAHPHSPVKTAYAVIHFPAVVFAYRTINAIHMGFDSFDTLREYSSTFEIFELVHDMEAKRPRSSCQLGERGGPVVHDRRIEPRFALAGYRRLCQALSWSTCATCNRCRVASSFTRYSPRRMRSKSGVLANVYHTVKRNDFSVRSSCDLAHASASDIVIIPSLHCLTSRTPIWRCRGSSRFTRLAIVGSATASPGINDSCSSSFNGFSLSSNGLLASRWIVLRTLNRSSRALSTLALRLDSRSSKS